MAYKNNCIKAKRHLKKLATLIHFPTRRLEKTSKKISLLEKKVKKGAPYRGRGLRESKYLKTLIKARTGGQQQKWLDTPFRNIITDQDRRQAYERTELRNLVFKSIYRSQPSKKKRNRYRLCHFALVEHPMYRKRMRSRGSLTRVRNRCICSGKSSILGHTRLSRIVFRKFASLGKIPGLLKI